MKLEQVKKQIDEYFESISNEMLLEKMQDYGMVVTNKDLMEHREVVYDWLRDSPPGTILEFLEEHCLTELLYKHINKKQS